MDVLSTISGWKQWRLYPPALSVPYPARWKKWMLYPPYPGGNSGISSLPSRSQSSLVVAMEALSNNITTPIMKKEQDLGGDLCCSVMVSSALSPGWILNFTYNLWWHGVIINKRGSSSCSTSRWFLNRGTCSLWGKSPGLGGLLWCWFLTGISLVSNTSITVKIGISYFGSTV